MLLLLLITFSGRCICAGFFRHACRVDPQEGYRTLVDHQQVFMHPSSALYNRYLLMLLFLIFAGVWLAAAVALSIVLHFETFCS